jgi:hypothetical protein
MRIVLCHVLIASLVSCDTSSATPTPTDGGVLTDDDLRALREVSGGIEDATPVFEQILARLTPGSTLVIPPGYYRIVKTLRLPPVDLTVRGSGQFSTFLVMDFPDGGGNFLEWHEQGTRPTRAGIELTDVSLLARSVQTAENAAAISFAYP